MSVVRSRWAAVGAAVAVSLGAGGIGLVNATISSDDRAVFVPIEPCRIADTRPAKKVGPKASPIGPAEIHTIQAHGTNGDCTIPNDATALSLNVTALGATQNSFMTIWGDGDRPKAASLNPIKGAGPIPNAVNTPLTTGGAFNVYNDQGSVHVVIDVNGYYANHNHDDRYYTKSQTNSQISDAIDAVPWSLSLPIASAYFSEGSTSQSWTISSGGSDGPNGLTLHGIDNAYGRFWDGFTLPPNYKAGDDVAIHIRWVSDRDNIAGCTFRLEDNGTKAYRPGQTSSTVATQFVGGVSNYVVLTSTNEGSLSSWSDNVIRNTDLVLPGTDLAPGDDITFALGRRASPGTASQDTCTGGLTVVGLNAGPA